MRTPSIPPSIPAVSAHKTSVLCPFYIQSLLFKTSMMKLRIHKDNANKISGRPGNYLPQLFHGLRNIRKGVSVSPDYLRIIHNFRSRSHARNVRRVRKSEGRKVRKKNQLYLWESNPQPPANRAIIVLWESYRW